MQLVNDIVIFWSRRPEPPQQPIPNPITEEDRQRNAKWNQYYRDTVAAYTNANFPERILGILREYKAKGVETGYLERAFEQPERMAGGGAYGGNSTENCIGSPTDLCALRELAYHVDANDQRIDLTEVRPKK